MRTFVSLAVLAALCSFGAAQDTPDKPRMYRLYPRDAQDRCLAPYEAQGSGAGDSLVMEAYAGATLLSRQGRRDIAGKVAFDPVTLAAGLTEYRFHLQRKTGSALVDLERADSVVCGDAYIVGGQSNGTALHCDNRVSEWVRG